jgi:hypothetical protein
MDTQTAISTVLNIAAIICIIFAVPIVLPVSAILGTLLIIFSVLFSLGTIGQIWLAYQK